ncbi:hypothetical protein AYO44_06265 [Planctomycetaceae bacterium SCGC AG-212-F19]|nr:hypothetical protein AYO44_06265 [Planctomycetaceae bacterium SCGC AG-212-F19]
MRPFPFILVSCLLLTTAAIGGEFIFPDGTPISCYGGLIVVRQGDQKIVSLGGALFPRKVIVTQATPEGPVVTKFTLPPTASGSTQMPPWNCAPVLIQVSIPDSNGLVYIGEELIRSEGTARQLQSPPLAPGRTYPLRLRGAFRVGDNLLIEDKPLSLRAGDTIAVTFDGSRAISVPLPRENVDLPAPRMKKD